jgi:glycosyltransferase involved in cell wall biosynthesis
MPTMSQFNRPLTGSLVRPLAQTPVLSVVVPTFERPEEMTLAVRSIADQIDAALDGKVEIIISDNASGPETQAVLEALAGAYPCVSYYIHANNEGGPYQVCAAPHRARGRWTWVFGDDDVLGEGGLRLIVDTLEKEQPGFLTVNRQVWNKALDQQLTASKHDLPDIRFDSFLDLLALFGFDQLSFFTSQIYATDVVRALDAAPYLVSHSRYCQLAYYLEAFHDLSAYYLSQPVVWHRWDPNATAVHAANFHDLAIYTPEMVQLAADRVGIATGLFERIAGRRSLVGAERRKITLVDNILENLWRCIALGVTITEPSWNIVDGLSRQWEPGHVEQLAQVREVYGKVDSAFQAYQNLLSNHRALAEPARAFSPEEIGILKQSEAAIMALQANVNDARKMALELSGGFS